MKKNNIPIGFKLIAITSFILSSSLLGMNYVAGVFFRRDTVSRIQEVTADKSRLLSLKVQADITYMMDRIQIISRSLLDEYKVSDLVYLEDLFYVGVYHRDVTLVREQMNPGYGDPIIDLQLFRDISNKVDFLSEAPIAPFLYNVTAVAKAPTVALVFPLHDAGGGDYFALGYFNQDIFTQAIDIVSEYETYIVNHQGSLLAHKNAELLKTGVSFRTDGIVQAMLKSPLNNGQMDYKDRNGINNIGSFFKIELGFLGVISTAERNKILQAVYQIRRRNYYITGLVLLVSIIIVYVFAKTLSRPIRRLVAAALEIEKGQFLLNIKVSTRDEIGELTKSFLKMGQGLAERDRMKNTLGKFVNEEVANLAMKGELRLGGERKEAAVFFSDIRSFTAISEKLTPEEVVEFLNEYMTVMVDCVVTTNGVVDKFIGDAVMAIWGAPVSHGNDTENAINSALMMRTALEKFNEGRGGDKKPIIKIGCGINTGPLVSGQIGSENRMEYTVIGDAVNLASRIESLSKPFGADILISEASSTLVKDIYYMAEMPPIIVKGKSDPVKIYAVLGRCDNLHSFQHIDQLRKYLGTEHVDLSAFDGKGEEKKFSAISPQKQTEQETRQKIESVEAESRPEPLANFIENAPLVFPRAVTQNEYQLTNELLSLRRSVMQQTNTPAAGKLSEIKQNGPPQEMKPYENWADSTDLGEQAFRKHKK